jgi:hypothetical protein
MLTANKIFTAALFSTTLLLGGCAAETTGDADTGDAISADQDLAASIAGYYRVQDERGAGLSRWIAEVNLHGDGTYEGNFGNDVSNLSGHHYWNAGTYRVEKKGGKTTVFFDSDGYEMRVSANGLELRFAAFEPKQPWFTMRKEASPVAITFAADGSATANGPLVPGGTALILYASARVHCSSKDHGFLAGSWAVHGVTNGWLDWGLGGPAKGYYRAIAHVPTAGHDFALWFHDTDNASCDHWDSRSGQNYHFAIGQ